MTFRYTAPIQAVIGEARWSLAEHLHERRVGGMSYRQLAEENGLDRTTASRYARTYERIAKRYGWDTEPALSCNQIRLRCRVCGEGFVASRADARYCSNACRQDAYRKRKQGAQPIASRAAASNGNPSSNGKTPKGTKP